MVTAATVVALFVVLVMLMVLLRNAAPESRRCRGLPASLQQGVSYVLHPSFAHKRT